MSLACVLAFLWKGTHPDINPPHEVLVRHRYLSLPGHSPLHPCGQPHGAWRDLSAPGAVCQDLVGHIMGGLGIVVVVSEVFFSGISGSSIADASAIGSLLLPSMVRAGYTPPGPPPSSLQQQGWDPDPSVSQHGCPWSHGQYLHCRALYGRFPPGISDQALTLMFIIYTSPARGFFQEPDQKRATDREILVSCKESVIPLMMPIIIFGGIFRGIFTATEAASVATAYAFIVSVFVYREVKRKDIYKIVVETAVMTGVVSLLVGAPPASRGSWPRTRCPGCWENSSGPFQEVNIVFLLLSIAVFFIFGALLDRTSGASSSFSRSSIRLPNP